MEIIRRKGGGDYNYGDMGEREEEDKYNEAETE